MGRGQASDSPPDAEAARAEAPAEEAPSVPAVHSETVLLVEDEKGVRDFFQDVLSANGYKVLVAEHPDAAMAVAETFVGKIDLLLTDVTMPVMSGRELADTLLRSRPKMKVLYMSGYTDSVVLREGVGMGDLSYLQKPIAPNVLQRKLRRVLTETEHVGGS